MATLDQIQKRFQEIQQQAGQIFKEAKGLGVNTGQIKDTTEFKLPDVQINQDTKNALENISNKSASALASATSLEELVKAQQEQMAEFQKQQQEAEKERKGLTQKLTSFFTGRQPLTQTIQEQMAKFQVPETVSKINTIVPEIQNLQLKLADIENRERQDLLAIQQNPQYSARFASREAKRVAQDYALQKTAVAAEIGAKTAALQALQGNIDTARNLISDIVNAQQYEDRQKLYGITTLLDLNKDVLDTLSSQEARVLNSVQNYLKQKVETERADLKNKWNLVIDAAQRGIDLGLSASDIKTMDYEKVLELYNRRVASLPAEKGYAPPEAYKIWELAGGKEGTGMDFGEWYKEVYKGGKLEPKVPTIYGLTPEQSYDVLFNPNPPEWFVKPLEQENQMTFTPDVTKQLWEGFKIKAIEKHQEIKEQLSGSGTSSNLDEFLKSELIGE